MTREDYYRQHKCCPRCGSKNLMLGLAGYIFDSRHPETYKDMNPAECLDCGYKGNVHSLVPEEKKS